MQIRAKTLAASVVGLAIACPLPVVAQENYETIVTIMRACSQIDDVTARVACYDNNIRPGATAPRQGAASAPPAAGVPAARATAQSAAPARSGGAAGAETGPAAVSGPGGFGADSLPQSRTSAEQAQTTEAKVASAQERAPGIYRLTLEDGGEWEFVETAPTGYDPPRAGAVVRIDRAALGSFRMRYGNQPWIRLHRIR